MEHHIKKEKKNGKTMYSYNYIVYHNPKSENGKELPKNKRVKKIRKSNMEKLSEAKMNFKQDESKAIEFIKSLLKEKETKHDDIFTLKEANERTIDFDLKPGTKRKYISIFKNYIEPYFDTEVDVKEVLSSTTVSEWKTIIDNSTESFTLKTKNSIIRRMRTIIEYSIIEKELDKKMLRNLKTQRGEGRKTIKDDSNMWTEKEFEYIIGSISKEHYMFKLFLLITERGLRFSETRALKVSDIFHKYIENKKYFYIKINKSMEPGNSKYTTPKSEKSNRTIMISKILYSEVLELVKKHNLSQNDFLFRYPNRKTVFIDHEIRTLFRYYNDTFLPNKRITPHEFRHRLGTKAISNDILLTNIADFLGHTPSELLNTYAMKTKIDEIKLSNI